MVLRAGYELLTYGSTLHNIENAPPSSERVKAALPEVNDASWSVDLGVHYTGDDERAQRVFGLSLAEPQEFAHAFHSDPGVVYRHNADILQQIYVDFIVFQKLPNEAPEMEK